MSLGGLSQVVRPARRVKLLLLSQDVAVRVSNYDGIREHSWGDCTAWWKKEGVWNVLVIMGKITNTEPQQDVEKQLMMYWHVVSWN